jgi:zinc transporter ZupT
LGFVIFALLERLYCRNCRSGTHKHHKVPAYLLAVLFSCHAFIAGSTLGLSNSQTDIMIIFIAIIAHKSTASFAMISNMQQPELTKRQLYLWLMFFSLTTPVGIIFGTIVQSLLMGTQMHYLQGVFNALTAGTFLYIGTLHQVTRSNQEHIVNYQYTLRQLLMLSSGLAVMALIAVWL